MSNFWQVTRFTQPRNKSYKRYYTVLHNFLWAAFRNFVPHTVTRVATFSQDSLTFPKPFFHFFWLFSVEREKKSYFDNILGLSFSENSSTRIKFLYSMTFPDLRKFTDFSDLSIFSRKWPPCFNKSSSRARTVWVIIRESFQKLCTFSPNKYQNVTIMHKNLYINYFWVLLFFNIIADPGMALFVATMQFENFQLSKNWECIQRNILTPQFASPSGLWTAYRLMTFQIWK